MKKTLRKLNLSRETLRPLENLPSAVGARPFSGTGHSCPEICVPAVQLIDIG